MKTLTRPITRIDGPHQGQPLHGLGAPIHAAKAAVVLLHGRGATAEDILHLADELARQDVTFRAPQAAGQTWYPFSFLVPLEENEPYLTSALRAVDDVLTSLEDGGIAPEKTLLVGFSQGACLALEYAARHPRRYGGIIAFTGGLIGNGEQEGEPPDDKTFQYDGSLDSTPVFIGGSDRDPHVPLRRIEQSVDALAHLGASVTKRIYEGMGHSINADEIAFARDLLSSLVDSAP